MNSGTRAQRCARLVEQLFAAQAAKRALDLKITTLRNQLAAALNLPIPTAEPATTDLKPTTPHSHRSTGRETIAANILLKHAKPITCIKLARLAGFSMPQARGCLAHLTATGTAKRLADGSYTMA